MQVSFPRPGRTMKGVLIAIAVFAIAGAVIVNWLPGGQRGFELYSWLRFDPAAFLGRRGFPRFWTLVTSGVLSATDHVSHPIFSLIGLYFLTPDLEKRWGGARILRFLLISVAMGNLFVLAALALRVPIAPGLGIGPLAAITATAIAWSKEHKDQQIRFMLFVPMSGRVLYWLTIALAFLYVVFTEIQYEGTAAPLGGVAAGLLFGGSPSPARALWLRVKLALLRRKGGGLTVEQLLDDDFRRPRTPPKKSSRKAPPLRVVQGGLDDDLKGRKPPKDKRFLN